MPELLLIVRERLRPGCEADYGDTESEIAAASARLGCPHPYLALAPVDGTPEVWWLNTFSSGEEQAEVKAAYARNQPLMAALQPLGERKQRFVQEVTTVLATRRAKPGRDPLRVCGARFFVVSRTPLADSAAAAFQAREDEPFVFTPAASREAAERIVAGAPGAAILAVQPQWSFADQAWIAADRDFWSACPCARDRNLTAQP
jgi:hypothetical protein